MTAKMKTDRPGLPEAADLTRVYARGENEVGALAGVSPGPAGPAAGSANLASSGRRANVANERPSGIKGHLARTPIVPPIAHRKDHLMSQDTPHSADNTASSLQARKDSVWAAWARIWNGDFTGADDLIDGGFRVHAALLDGSSDAAIRGPQGLTSWIGQTRSAFPDVAFATEVGPFVDGEYLIGRWEATGTYGGGWPGAAAPVGTKIVFTGTDILRFENGKAVEYWVNSDTASLLGQLGVI